MSLINLLTVGATLRGRERSGSYNLASINSRPAFNAAKTAAAKEPIAVAAERSPGSPLEPASVAAPQQRQTVRTQEVLGTQLQAGRSPSLQGVGSEGTTDLPASFPPLKETALQSAKPAVVMPETFGESTLKGIKKFMSRFLFGRQTPPAKTATVQTELALENVTVVRNDLSDESWPGDSRSRSISDPTDTVGSWLNLTACFGKKAAPAKAATEPKPETKFVEGPEPGLIARI